MERKPYYVLRIHNSNFKLHEGIARGTAIQLYLTDEEVRKYNKRVIEILKPYTDITMKRYLYILTELILYAISEVLYV